MASLLLRITDKLRMPYDPSPLRRAEISRFLAGRPALSHEEWFGRYAAPHGVSLDFVRWFRETCSKCFEFDLSAALPQDRLLEDLGMYDATWGDVDVDILEEFEARYGAKIPEDEQECVRTFGQFLEALWSHAQNRPNAP